MANPYIIQKPPTIIVSDLIVMSRDIKDDPDEAFLEAATESEKAEKSLDLISRSTLKALSAARDEIKELKQKLKDKTDDIAALVRELKTLSDEIEKLKKKVK